MINFKKIRNLLAAASLCLMISNPVQAASYTVASGDSLYTIGKLFNTTANTIMKDNNLTSTTIYPGKVLTVPGYIYTIKSGDSLYLICQRYGISISSLRQANNKWDNYLNIGDKLILPGVTATNTNSTAVSTTNNSYTANDLDLLSRLIMAEAQGEPYNAKVAVGAVVLNRVKDSRFPNSIYSVIYQKSDGYYQFTPVVNGWIDRSASAECVQAARDALNGTDPSNGAAYYFDYSTTNQWLWSKPLAARIGKLVFVY
ncbi:LysM peptidoglycan-binding domain-containing protein [Clostridium sp. P21]|uniref:LysM peptidoglycan-binding domain-containing protein n=1 Tax=Clostridium muellerianum TaxID=2716538 RepID=A0A7Y0ELS4_9CLOT|nr:cell wall hydrolase [Clostridium muellerianum]NMM65736.1 LysM peptidoglycan-binding domain-containing protein [Clostridium muellerianum]